MTILVFEISIMTMHVYFH